MPAPFVRDVLGLRRPGGLPNTSDSNDELSVELGTELIAQVGLPAAQVGPENPGELMVTGTARELTRMRPDLVASKGSARAFAQYAHLQAYPAFDRAWKGPGQALAALDRAIESLTDTPSRERMTRAAARLRRDLETQAAAVDTLRALMPTESLLDLDVTVSEPTAPGRPELLHVGLSGKWSLRTDRAQDCVSQGNKLVALRRGRMPHFAVLTAEPRPAMLRILADGSGAIDCIYHLDLAALRRAVAACAARRPDPSTWQPARTLDRMVTQGRLRDYDDLVAEVLRLPVPSPLAPPQT